MDGDRRRRGRTRKACGRSAPDRPAAQAASRARGRRRRRRLPGVGGVLAAGLPLALVLIVLFALPTVLFLVVSFFDYDRIGIYPAFLLDNYRDLLTTPRRCASTSAR